MKFYESDSFQGKTEKEKSDTIRKMIRVFFDDKLSLAAQLLLDILTLENYKNYISTYTLYAASSKLCTVKLKEYEVLFNNEFGVEETFMVTLEEVLREIEAECIYAMYDDRGVICRESLISTSKVFRNKEYVEIRFNPRFGPVRMLDVMDSYISDYKKVEKSKPSHLSLVVI